MPAQCPPVSYDREEQDRKRVEEIDAILREQVAKQYLLNINVYWDEDEPENQAPLEEQCLPNLAVDWDEIPPLTEEGREEQDRKRVEKIDAILREQIAKQYLLNVNENWDEENQAPLEKQCLPNLFVDWDEIPPLAEEDQPQNDVIFKPYGEIN